MRDNIQEMCNHQLKELERLQNTNSELDKKCDFTNKSCKWTEKKFLDISKSLLERGKSFKAVRAEKEALNSTNVKVEASLQHLWQGPSHVWKVWDDAWYHGFFAGREGLKSYLLSNPKSNLQLLDLDLVTPGSQCWRWELA